MKRIAAIDLGSNAIRLAIGEIRPNGRILISKTLRAPVRLGQEAFDHGTIAEETQKKLIRAFEKFHKLIRKFKVQHLLAVSTSAMREAKNNNLIIKRVADKTGIHLCVIDGIEEARLIYLAVTNSVDLTSRYSALVDIGGGSLEISLVENGILLASQTFPLGTVRLLTTLRITTDTLEFSKIDSEIKRQEKSIVDFIHSKIGNGKIEVACGTGGNIEALGKLRKQMLNRASANFFTRDELDEMILRLTKLSYIERINQMNLRPDRADVIVPAAMVLQRVFKILGIADLIIPGVGVKEGALLHIAAQKKSNLETNLCACAKPSAGASQSASERSPRASESRRI